MLSDANLAGELLEQTDRVLPAEQPLDELRPPQRRTHLDAQADLVLGRVPGQMAGARRHHDVLARPGRPLLAADAEGRGPADDLVALLHLGVDVRGGAVAGP